MAKKAKAAPSARPVPSPSGLAPSPAPRKPPQPLQLPLARYFSLVSLQLSLVPLCLFVLPRALRTGVPLVFTAAIRPLVADPVAALSWACLGLFALQVQVGWRLYTWRVEGVAGTTLTENPVKRVASATATLAVASVGMHALLVLLGAPFLRLLPCTALLAIFLTLLAFGPLSLSLDPFSVLDGADSSSADYLHLFSHGTVRGQLDVAHLYPATGTLAGALVAASTLALDWDRPWQRWPVPVVIGGWLGHALGSVAGVVMCAALAVEEEARKAA